MSVVKKPSSDITRFLPENYVTDINTEGKIREITKIRINLQKFSGYNSKLDIHSFQSEFLMPEMPDLLTNNLLEGSALSLVKSLTGIEGNIKSLTDIEDNIRERTQNQINIIQWRWIEKNIPTAG